MTMRFCKYVWITIVVFSVFLTATRGAAARGRPAVRIAGGHRWGFPILSKMLDAFCRQEGLSRQRFALRKWSDSKPVERFTREDADILLHYALTDVECGTEDGGEPITCERFIVAQARAAVIVDKNNPLSRMSTEEVRNTLRTATIAEKKEGLRRMDCYGEPKWRSISSHIIRRNCMLVGGDYSGTFYVYRDDMKVQRSRGAIVGKIAREPNAIGTVLWEGRRLPGVKPLAIAKTEEGKAIAPGLEPIIQKDYPLSEYIALYLWPGASPPAREFCEFAVGKKASEIAAKEGLVTPYQEHLYRQKRRLRDVRRGRGKRLPVLTLGLDRAVVRDLTTEYVRAREAVQLRSRPYSRERLAAGAFLKDSSDGVDPSPSLLLTDHKLSAERLKEHQEGWEKLQPTEHLLAGRAVAIIVNRANKIDALSVDQIKTIFSGKRRDWSELGRTGLSSPRGAEGVPIRTAGLPGRNRAAELFYQQCVSRRELRCRQLKRDSARAIAAVSMNARAIGFVDLKKVPKEGRTVKVLDIRVGEGKKRKALGPTPRNIQTGAYPLSQRFYLYVHPEARETEKSFARFLSTSGKSCQNPYDDTVKAVMEVYESHDLVPAADTAIRRLERERWESLD
ncbi:MAG: substrate-binding domain-containing protein [Candidatus Brocadiia bacterium]